MSNGLQEAAMDNFISREILGGIASSPGESTDASERSRIMSLLAEEVDKLKLELSGRRDASEGRSPVNTATEDRVEHDGDEQQGAG